MSHRGVKRHISISARLMLNVVIIVGIVLIALNLTVAVTLRTTYYNKVTDYLGTIAMSFNRVQAGNSTEFDSQAHILAEDFPFKSQVEVQFCDNEGRIVVSTSGFNPQTETYGNKKAEGGSVAIWTGDLSTGERVMATTANITGNYGTPLGSVRCITSLERVDSQLLFTDFAVALGSIAVLVFTMILSKIYAQSIVKPIKEVSSVAHRIAGGDLKSRIEVHELNEIGELCHTINYMADELQSADKMKNEFISSVSHELRTPLTAIKGWGETVKGSVHTDSQLVEKGINVILSETERLSSLVEELLDFSRMQSGRMTYKTERVDLLAELGEAVCIYEEAARRAGLTLTYSEPDMIVYVIGDAHRLMQVFVNVLDNAVKYNKEGGSITVKVAAEDNCVTVSVTDTGVGIAAADVDKVKEKFYKANQTVHGSGIGLAVADEIIRYHNGILNVQSVEGEGTTVTVTLPTASSEGTDTAEAKPFVKEDSNE